MRSLWLLLLVGCAGKPAVATVAPLDDIEISVIHVDLGTPGNSGHAFLKLRNGTQPAKVRVVGVEIAGGTGSTFLVRSTEPSLLDVDDYKPWNEQIGSEDAMWIRYSLEGVDWDHFGDRDVVPLSVTVEVDGRARVFSVPRRERQIVDDVDG